MKRSHEKNARENAKALTDAEHYAKMRQIPVEEKEEILRHITREALENAPKMIVASGQKPEKYSPITRECMAAMIYGMLIAMSIENLGYYEWRWTECMMAMVANTFFAMEEEQSAALATYLYQGSDKNSPEYNVNIFQLVHIGIDAFYCLDQPEFLANGMRKVLDACYEDFGTGEEN
mgnify:CR=1 FL=1